jgi:ABC-type branched-subunit amino acid transport system substrate-binding protein
VGQVAPLSGLDANQARAYATGMSLVFSSVNRAGGVNGHRFSLVTKDDGGRPADTVSVARQMLTADRPIVLAGFFGNKNISDLVGSGLLANEGVALLGYRTAEIRSDTALVYSIRAGLSDEITKITEHLATIGITRLALFHEDGPGAGMLIAAANAAAQVSKVAIVARGSFPSGTAKVTMAVNELLRASPQAIIMVCNGAVAAGFIDQYRAAGGAALLFAHSGADVEQLSRLLGEEQMHGVAIAQVTPNPYKIATPVSKELSDLIAKTPNLDVPVSYAMMEGFINAKVIVEAVRRMGSRITREAMVHSLETMDRVDLGGYQVGFKPASKSGSKYVELSIITAGGKVRQ